MSYKNLEIWKLADELVVEIHETTLTKLPKFEMFEVGGQIRRSSKSVKSTIVEGYGRKRYKPEFIKFLVYSLGSMMKPSIIWKLFIKQNRCRMTRCIIIFTQNWRYSAKKSIFS